MAGAPRLLERASIAAALHSHQHVRKGRGIVIKVGISVHSSLLVPDALARRRVLNRAADAGLDHVTVGDHISFHGGTGFDGLISAASVLSTHDELRVIVGVYQAALRHPMITARQLATISEIAPGRLIFGAGVAGEDRSEISNAGVDPATRGRRLDETLMLLRALAGGEPVDHVGEFFTLESAKVLPVPTPTIPIIIGGAGDAAINRTAKYGDGWLGIFCSARKFKDTREKILAKTTELERPAPGWFGMNVWTGFDVDVESAKHRLGQGMEELYHLPYEKFQHITPAGNPAQVAEWLSPFVEGGAENLTIIPVAESVEAGIDATAEVRQILQKSFA